MKEYGIGIVKARCKMSIFSPEINECSLCAMNCQVICEGMHEDKINCPFWK